MEKINEKIGWPIVVGAHSPSYGFEKKLFRMYCEPKRMLKRYICDDLVFFWYLLKQVLGLYKNPWKE